MILSALSLETHMTVNTVLMFCVWLTMLVVILAKIIFYTWQVRKHEHESKQTDRIEKLLEATERLNALVGDRLERTKNISEELPEKTADKTLQKITQAANSGILVSGDGKPTV